MVKRLLITILIVQTAVLFIGCNNNSGFQSAYEQFRDSYYKATQFYDSDEERLEALKKIDPIEFGAELDNMKSILDTLSNNVETETERKAYVSLKSDYDDLVFLLNNYNKYDSLSEDEKVEVENKLVGVFINRDAIEKSQTID